MAFGYAPQMTPTFTRIIKRPLTEIEKGFAVKSYKVLQKSLRGIAAASLVLFALNTFLLPGSGMDWAFTFVITLLTLIIGAVALGMAVNTIIIRRKMADMMRSGNAVEVQAPAYKSRATKNAQMFTVGPITLFATPEVLRLVQEGGQTSVLCIPKMKVALSVNNVGLQRGARVTCPPNIETMAEQSYAAPQQPMAPQQAAYQQHQQPSAPQAPPQPTYPQYEPPPPPDE